MRLVLAVGHALPDRFRSRLLRSMLAPAMRGLMNRMRPETCRLTVVPVGGALNGHRMLLDRHTQKAFVFGVYEREVVRVVRQIVRPGWTVVDVGAHTGYYTLLLRSLVGAAGRVVAFEPVPENFEVLRRNVLMNGYADVRLENCAVSERTGALTMARRDGDPLTSVTGLDIRGDMRVRTVALDEYFGANEPVRFLKVDVEGAEALVVEGMRSLLTQQRPVLVVEVHGFKADHDAVTILRQLGYRVDAIDARGAKHHVLAIPS